ncbi:sensor histidine kinase [Megalodesulfovibrio paquesii]
MLQGASLQKWKGELTQPFSDTLTYIDYSLRAYLGTALEGKEAFAIKSLQLTIKEFATDAISKNDIHAFIQIVHEQCLLLKKLLFIASKEASVIFMHNPKTSLKEFQDKVTAVCPESTKLYPELIRQLYDQASIAFVKRCKTVAENLKEAAEEVLQGNISGHLLDSMLLPLQYEPKVYNSMALQGEKIMDALLGSIRHDIFSLRSKVTRNYYKSRWDAFWGNTEAQQEKIALDREIDSIYKRLKSISGFPVRVGLVEVNIFRLIQNTLNSSFRGANIKLNCPPSSQQMTVFGDPTLVDIILRNILNNALEASAQNTAITIELSFKHDLSIVKILDNGCGIAEDDLPFIFDSGVSISKAKHTGEGLHIVKVLSDAMGFKIHVTSVPTQGTTVTITMPCKNVKLQN